MYTDEQFEQLEQEERELTDEAILLMLLVLAGVKGELEKELRNFYQQYGRDGVVTYAEARKWVSDQDRTRRLTALTLVVSGAFIAAYDELENHFRSFLTNVIIKESAFFGIKVDIEKVLSRKWGVDDLYWLKRLEDDVDLWRTYVNMDIKRAMHQGKSIDEVLKKLDKRFSSINSALKNIGITESTAIGSMSRQEVFKTLGIGKYQFYTRADERTCETCGSMHGLIFPLSAFEVGVTASPLHPHCRCWEVPILE